MSEENEQQKTPPAGGPNTPDFNKLEESILQFWDESKIFEKSLEQTKDGEPYIFYDGPPFATGLPHYGSILPSVIKDAIPRYQTMKGRYVRRRWGWDCHGLPIENIVEQHLKISGKKQIEEIGVERFNQVCRDNVLKYTEEWGKTIRRIARWVEFDNSYKTMDTSYMESVWWALKEVWNKNLIYEDRKVLLYCSRCETPISNFEVAMDNSYRDVSEESVFVKFKLTPRQRIGDNLTDDKTFVLAWTTTPWTLPGNTALNVGPDIGYVLVEQHSPDSRQGGERYILAKDRLEVLDGEFETVAEFSARSLEGLSYEPLYPGIIPDPESRAHKIYLADFVTTEDGTGVVHNAAMYGEEDYQLAKEKNLPRVDMLDSKGQYLPVAPEHLRGVFFKDADPIVLKELSDKGLVYKTQSYLHSYPFCWRCGTPLFYNALSAWFIKIQEIKQELLANNESVNWYPEHLKYGRFAKGIESAPDWNISRNRYWATALPFWKCENKDCKHVVCIGSVAELKEKAKNFSEVYPQFDPANLEAMDLHRPYIDQIELPCEKCQGTMKRIPEVIDCWVESGSMPFAELHAPFESQDLFQKRFPADFVVEYIPQTRAWFYVMHVMNSILFGKAPFKNVVTTGTILAEDGSKMSKSKNNYPDPWLILNRYGADALRFYLLTSAVVNGEDLNFSEKGVAEVQRKVTMLLYNVWSFYRLYTQDKISTERPQSTHVLDQWILAKLGQTHREVTKHLDGYNTAAAGRIITEFINELSTWYVRRSRDRMKDSGEEGKAALAVLGYVLAETTKLLAPFMPFLAEFVYKDITGNESVHLEKWSESAEVNQTLLDQMDLAREVVSVGLALRKDNKYAVRQPLASLGYMLKDSKLELSFELESLIREELNVKEVAKLTDRPEPKTLEIAVFEGVRVVDSLHIALTDELRAEGLAREIERQIQDLRKKSGLKVGELVDVYYNTQDESLEAAITKLIDRKKTFVNQVAKSLEVEVDFETQATVDGKAIWLGMIKA